MSQHKDELESFLIKCRFCMEDSREERSFSINEEIERLFLDLTKVNVSMN